ncbi:hypothetical protein FHR38_003300 [Micromonospora polyrhachis]|uniref:Tyr recombinase domain-containing protein n=1 Tax=Micromonospora polyrhachis TaxID=1282883 RepID=A0A7W7WQK0_9ACTN|nr:hypothetical protein [Micromonospora polyrhachis]
MGVGARALRRHAGAGNARAEPDPAHVPASIIREQRALLDDEERLALAQRLLRDQLDDPPARLPAVLVLLFGQRITRLAALDVDAVTVTDSRTTLTLAVTLIRLREPLAGLAREVAGHSRRTGSRWLFPSSQGNRPLSGERLRDRAAKLGLTNAVHARNSALAALADQLPPSTARRPDRPVGWCRREVVQGHRRDARHLRRPPR